MEIASIIFAILVAIISIFLLAAFKGNRESKKIKKESRKIAKEIEKELEIQVTRIRSTEFSKPIENTVHFPNSLSLKYSTLIKFFNLKGFEITNDEKDMTIMRMNKDYSLDLVFFTEDDNPDTYNCLNAEIHANILKVKEVDAVASFSFRENTTQNEMINVLNQRIELYIIGGKLGYN